LITGDRAGRLAVDGRRSPFRRWSVAAGAARLDGSAAVTRARVQGAVGGSRRRRHGNRDDAAGTRASHHWGDVTGTGSDGGRIGWLEWGNESVPKIISNAPELRGLPPTFLALPFLPFLLFPRAQIAMKMPNSQLNHFSSTKPELYAIL